MNQAAADAYMQRFARVLEYIDAHLEQDLSVEALSAVAAFSKFHFHRQFSELLGLGVYKYVQLVRLKRASFQLAFREQRILDVALDAGYESHEAFARAFKKNFGQTPAEFRQSPDFPAWHAKYRTLDELRREHMKTEHSPEDVRIVNFEETRVAALEHRGDPNRVGESVRKFIEWRKQSDLRPPLSATYNLLWNDPESTSPDQFRLDICAGTPRPVPANTHGVVEKVIPAGRCAVLRHVGSEESLFAAVHYLYATWLPGSGEEPRDFPLFLQRVRFFPDVPEREAVTDVFLPLR
ncbi:MAG: AraC family transcriptional regulator [Polyangiaceae bacterium]